MPFFRKVQYDTMLGRFLGPEQIPVDPDPVNVRRYVKNAPTSAVDPFGTTTVLSASLMSLGQYAKWLEQLIQKHRPVSPETAASIALELAMRSAPGAFRLALQAFGISDEDVKRRFIACAGCPEDNKHQVNFCGHALFMIFRCPTSTCKGAIAQKVERSSQYFFKIKRGHRIETTTEAFV